MSTVCKFYSTTIAIAHLLQCSCIFSHFNSTLLLLLYPLPVVYLHETHAVTEWTGRMKNSGKPIAVAACHDENVARSAKAAGFKEIFYAKKSDTAGLTNTVLEAVEFAKSSRKLYKS